MLRVIGIREAADFTYQVEINPTVNSFWIYPDPDEAVYYAHRLTFCGSTLLCTGSEGEFLELESQFQQRSTHAPPNLGGLKRSCGLPLLQVAEPPTYSAIFPRTDGFVQWFKDGTPHINHVLEWGNVEFLLRDDELVGIQATITP
ncbi:hypothetical protein [Deinococcus aquaedulcis]|uniref:hypothetical protein n=1 Tax=Deinococcus aquaedulcis TaxID=2840455 RepID=UPI001C835424|nr:hypothetical protein [Deinococcus aquaedulcis]